MLSGRAKVSTLSEGGEGTVLGFRGAGDMLGELSAIDGKEHVASVTVVEPGEAMVVRAEQFIAALEGVPGLSLVLLRAIVGRLRDADQTRSEFTALDVDGRVAHRLAELADEYGEPDDAGDRSACPSPSASSPVGSARPAKP